MADSARIFINYRHADSGGWVDQISRRLRSEFGEAAVFHDLPSIPPGEDIVERVQRALAAMTVMVSCIGPQWLTLRDGSGGERRIDGAEDLLRIEIEEALASDTTIIPVLVGGAGMPHADDLPSTIRSLATRMALSLPPPYFEVGLDKLVERIAERAVPGAVPLRAFLGPDAGTLRAGWRMFLPDLPGLVQPGVDTGWRAARRWILEHGGADYGASRLRLDLLGLSTDPVHVQAVRARILERLEGRTPGAAITSPSGGEISIVPCIIDLDDDEPVGRVGASNQDFGDPFTEDYVAGAPLVLTIAYNELVPIRIIARARRATYRWQLELDVLVRGEQRVMTIPLETGPTVTASPSNLDEPYTWGWFLFPTALGPSDAIHALAHASPGDYASAWTAAGSTGDRLPRSKVLTVASVIAKAGTRLLASAVKTRRRRK